MSKVLNEPPIEPVRNFFSAQCVLMTGIATGGVEPLLTEAPRPAAFQMGQRDGYHVVVAHLAASRSLREAADKCVAFGRGVEERAGSHPYGPDWCTGFAQATLDAAADIAMYAATESLPAVDKRRLRVARTAARHLTPLPGTWLVRPDAVEPPRNRHEW